jgi:hypothetical protein
MNKTKALEGERRNMLRLGSRRKNRDKRKLRKKERGIEMNR